MACIELIACTGAGKSTLINAILRFCQGEEIDEPGSVKILCLSNFGLRKSKTKLFALSASTSSPSWLH